MRLSTGSPRTSGESRPLATALRRKRSVVQVLQPDAGQRCVVPGFSVPREQKPAERRAAEHLLRAAAAVVELPLVADRIGMRLNDDLKVIAAHLRLQVDINHDAEQRLRLARDLLKQPEHFVHSDHLAAVVLADLQDAALGVGEAADPLEILVPPGPLPLHLLRFRRHGRHPPWRHRGWAGGWNQ